MKASAKKRKIILGIVGVIVLSLILSALWWKGYFLPSWVNWCEKEMAVPENPEGYPGEIVLKNRKLVYQVEGNVLYTTPDEWYVTDFLINDIDQDDMPEVLFLVWSHSDFGDHHPFYQKKDTFSFSEHLYIFDLQSYTLTPQWMSSRLSPQIKSWSINADHELMIEDPYDETSTWKWYGYGIVRTDEE